jgi:hypothetical protein
MVAIQAPREAFDIGRVTQRTFEVIGRNIVPFGIMAVLLVGLPGLLISWWQTANFAATGLTAGAMFNRGLTSMVIGLINLGLVGVLQASIVYGSVCDLEGKRPAVGDLVSQGIRFALPAIGISLLFGLSVVFGLLLLVVPGAIAGCVWIVALPAGVVERTGVFGAFSRSGELTRGSRWRIFLMLVIYGVILMLVEMAMTRLTGGFAVNSLASRAAGAPLPALALLPTLLVQVVINVINYLIISTGIAVIYQELRTIREGVVPADLSGVFD